MTQEIIDMARDSGMELYGLGKDRYRFVHHLEAFAKLVDDKATAREREAMLDLVDAYAKNNTDLADAIRARGES